MGGPRTAAFQLSLDRGPCPLWVTADRGPRLLRLSADRGPRPLRSWTAADLGYVFREALKKQSVVDRKAFHQALSKIEELGSVPNYSEWLTGPFLPWLSTDQFILFIFPEYF